MRLRSTGLGKTELEADIVNIKKVHDLLIFFVNTNSPVKWQTRMAFQEKDLRDLIRALLKPRNLFFVLKALLFNRKGASRIVDF